MPNNISKAVKIFIVACYVSIHIPSHAFANDTSLVEAFESATKFTAERRNKVTYKLENCVLQKVLTNLNYCKGGGHRVITTSIDFREVKAIDVADVHGSFIISFDLDFGGPGAGFILLDRLLNGAEGGFERYSEKSDAALEKAKLNSGVTFSNCDGTVSQESNQMALALITKLEPEGWSRMIDIARECRSPKSLSFNNRRSEK